MDWRVFGALIGGGLFGIIAATRLSPLLAGRAVLARRMFAVMVILTALYVGWRALACERRQRQTLLHGRAC